MNAAHKIALLLVLFATGCVVPLGADLTLNDFTLSSTDVNVTGQAQTVTCSMTIVDGAGPEAVLDAGCVISSPSCPGAGCQKATCLATSHIADVWTCPAQIKADAEGGTWTVDYVFARDTAFEQVRATYAQLGADGKDNEVVVDSDLSDTDPPSVSSFVFAPNLVPSDVGGTVTCDLQANDQNAIQDSGCTAAGPSGQLITCIKNGQPTECDLTIPAASEEGVWTVKNIFVRDRLYNATVLSTTQIAAIPGDTTFTVQAPDLACSGKTPDLTTTGAWANSSAQTSADETLTFEAYIRTNDLDAYVCLAEGTMADYADCAATLRLDFTTGNFDVWNDAAGVDWYANDVAISYATDTWYKIKMVVNVTSGTYDVWVPEQDGACDDTQVLIADDYELRASALPISAGLDRYALFGWDGVPPVTVDLQGATWTPSGTVGPPTSSVFPVQIAANGRTLEDKNGTPFLIHGDTGWAIAANLCAEADQATCPDAGARVGSIDDYFDDLVAKGFNTVLLTIPEAAFTDHTPLYDNAYGDSPFTTGTSFAPSNMNETYWAHADYVLEAANDRDLLVLLSPFYSGFNDSEGWRAELSAQSQTVLANYADWFCTRYDDYPNLLYVWMNDFSVADWTSWSAKTNAMVNACSAADTDKLHTFHGRRQITYSSYSNLDTQGWLDLRAAYGDFDLYVESEAEYTDTPAKVTFAFEGVYENTTWTTIDPRGLRAQHWLAALAGGRAGSIYGNENIWTAECDTNCSGFKTSNDWVTALGDAGRLDMAHLKDILETVAWQNLVPSFDNSIITTGSTRSAASDGANSIVIYTNQTGNLTVDTTGLTDTTYTSTWWDPSDGSSQAGSSGSESASSSFTHPGNNSAGDPDWVLIISNVAAVSGRGPSGQWPSDFAAYTTAAELTTNGTFADLQSKINDSACTDGCVIEHAGTIGSITSRAAGTGRIVIRPPINQRANYCLTGASIENVDNILIAGYGGSCNLGIYARDCQNCGYAWIESRHPNGYGEYGFNCSVGDVGDSIWYEIVFANYADWDQEYDRGGMYGVPDQAVDCDMTMTGWYAAGVMCPDNKPPGINCHSDTVQTVCWPNSICRVYINDSIMFPSEDKVIQTSSWDILDDAVWIDNTTMIAPPYAGCVYDGGGNPYYPGCEAEARWTGTAIRYDGAPSPGTAIAWYPADPPDQDLGPQGNHTTAMTYFTNSTLIGACYPQPGGFNIRVNDSDLYDANSCPQDPSSSGNTTLSTLPAVPAPPSHAQLDAVWSP